MSTGMDHYKWAEKLAELVKKRGRQVDGEWKINHTDEPIVALAQVHATLALADFTAEQVGRMGP